MKARIDPMSGDIIHSGIPTRLEAIVVPTDDEQIIEVIECENEELNGPYRSLKSLDSFEARLARVEAEHKDRIDLQAAGNAVHLAASEMLEVLQSQGSQPSSALTSVEAVLMNWKYMTS